MQEEEEDAEVCRAGRFRMQEEEGVGDWTQGRA